MHQASEPEFEPLLRSLHQLLPLSISCWALVAEVDAAPAVTVACSIGCATARQVAVWAIVMAAGSIVCTGEAFLYCPLSFRPGEHDCVPSIWAAS